jgi:hypothetical protein
MLTKDDGRLEKIRCSYIRFGLKIPIKVKGLLGRIVDPARTLLYNFS